MKFVGRIGFVVYEETRPDVWEEVEKEFKYKGEITQDRRRYVGTEDSVNTSMKLNNHVSVLMDRRLRDNYAHLKYVVWNGSKWKVDEIEIDHPRINIYLGQMYE